VRVLIDYRPALRQRSGAGEYTHQLVKALVARFSPAGPSPVLDISVFSSSWKDRLAKDEELTGVRVIDRRVPVRVLNYAWHRLAWPPAEVLTGRRFDVTHSSHPLLMPTSSAAQVVTIHDLDFLTHPERTRDEVRRDYPDLARSHARRADQIIVPSEFTAAEVVRHFDVTPEHISVCPPGAPAWEAREAQPESGYILFLGTLEPRKNLGGLLDAYERVVSLARNVPQLILAGRATADSQPLLDRLKRPPLDGRVRQLGYVDSEKRRGLYEGARLFVLPSFEEGFGMPVLEAMTLGVPVVASSRGALPEIVADAGPLVDPEDPDALAAAIRRLIEDKAYAAACAERGVARARAFNWEHTAERVYETYQHAIARHQCASA
jgi:glycosyltransferase involved in cell wall biosynthesis